MRTLVALSVCVSAVAGCGGIESLVFPMFGPAPLAEPPAPMGPFTPVERRIEVADLGDGMPGGITVFEPAELVDESRPVLVWVLGVNNSAHYHQSFHEYMASWGYVDLVPDTRALSFADSQYNKRITDIAVRTLARAAEGGLDINADPQRMTVGGYSSGGSMAAFAAALEPRAKALAMWVPAQALVWQGVDPGELLPMIGAPSLFLLAELDDPGTREWQGQMQTLMAASAQTVEAIPQGVHLFFQQPDFPVQTYPDTAMTKQEQMRIGFIRTRAFLDEKLGLPGSN